MKKLLSVILASVLVFTLVACGGSGGSTSSAKTIEEAQKIWEEAGYTEGFSNET